MRRLENSLYLLRALHDHILPTRVEIRNRVPIRRRTDFFRSDTMEIRLEAIIGPCHCWNRKLASDYRAISTVGTKTEHLLNISPMLTTIGPVSADNGVNVSPMP